MKRILAVDDDPAILVFEEKVLTHEGYEVVTAMDGETAIRLIEEQPFDLVLLDIMMPGIDGFEVSRVMRKEEDEQQRVPVVLVSAREDPEAYKEGFSAGATIYLTKPFNAKQLAQVVRSMIK